MVSIEDFVKKYKLDDFSEALELRGHDKVDFYDDFNKILKAFCRIFDKLTSIASLRGGQVMMSVAKLEEPSAVINKTDVKNSLNIDRLEKLVHAFEYLEHEEYISIEEKTSKFHIIRLNEKDNPDFTLFREIVQKYWTSPQEELEKAQKLIGGS